MKAEIIAVGTELLIGQIANTNAVFISRKLNEYGIPVYFHSVVGDNATRLIEVLNIALIRSDFIVLTGGLGPTEDDLTKETVSGMLGLKLKKDEQILSNITSYFNCRNIRMPGNNEKQALVPEGAFVLNNTRGTAPGFYIEHEGKKIVILPGPPIEMEPMFEYFLEKYISRDRTIHSKFINIFGVGESTVEENILDLIHKDSLITLATYASIGQVQIRITTVAPDSVSAEEKLSAVVSTLYDRFGNNIYAEGEISLSDKVFNLLMEKGKTVACAESCTGGLISKILTDRSGASAVFMGGAVVYSNLLKERLIGIRKSDIESFGAVSSEICSEMAANIAKISQADFGLAVTGIAGPTGGSTEKPAGTVFIGLYSAGATQIKKYSFNGDRNKIRNMAAMAALDMLRRELIK